MGLINWLAKKAAAQVVCPPPAPTMRDEVEGIVRAVLVDGLKASAEAQSERSKSDMEFFRLMAELKASSAARTLGKRSGAARAKRALSQRNGCPICAGHRANPDGSPLTRAQIRDHMSLRCKRATVAPKPQVEEAHDQPAAASGPTRPE